MQPRSKWWIVTIVLLFVLSFLYAFQPIRRAPQATVEVQSTFRFTWPQPLVEDPAQFTTKAAEIQQFLKTKGLDLNRVDQVAFKEKNILEISTLALDEKQSAADARDLLTALNEKYPGVASLALPEEEQKEQPIKQFGPLALYRPVPQVKLGLDLIGGAHVVLRALPETTLTFTSPEDQPLVKIETTAATPEAATKPAATTTVTSTMLIQGIRDSLARAGADLTDVRVTVPGANLVMVQTRAASENIATKQQKVVNDYLTHSYPGVTITADKPQSVFLEKNTASQVQSVIERRLYAMSEIREPLIQVQGNDRLIVELPGVKDPDRVVQILKSTALLEFRLIPQRYSPIGAATDDYAEWRDSQTQQTVPWERVMAEAKAEFTGRDLMSNSAVEPDQNRPGKWVVRFELRGERKTAFRDFTRRNVGRLMAIVLDGVCQMAPSIKGEIPGSGIIEGNFDAQQARDLKLLLNAGALPVPLEIAENRTISATLGANAIQRSLIAGLVGFCMVVVFMIIMYRLPGFLADIALCLYVLIVLAVLVFTKSTLTLPGIAGIILSIGMAVDANILIFERLKEEVWSGKSIRAAIDAGFERAWTAILDSNVNSLIVAAVLYFMGTSAVKSFAVTLFVGVVCSLFTAVTVSRWMVTMVGNSRIGQKLHLFGIHQTS